MNKGDFFKLWASPSKAKLMMEDGYSLKSEKLVEALFQMRDSFPDYKFAYQSIQEPKPNHIIIEGVQFSGTNTGKYFAPLELPAIPATGNIVLNDEERFFLEMENGKIKTWRIVGLGVRTGLVGLYEGIGGMVP